MNQRIVEDDEVQQAFSRKAEKLTGINIDKDPIEVEHASLTRAGDSVYRSVCPVCKIGILLVGRDRDMRLQRDDYCILCAQQFRYIGNLGFCDKERPLD